MGTKSRIVPVSRRREVTVRWIVAAVLVVVSVTAVLWTWRAPVLELVVEGVGTKYLRLGDELQFALAWEGVNADGERTVAIVLLEAADDGRLTVISSTLDDERRPSVTVGDSDVRFRVRASANPALIYGGGQLMLSAWYPDDSELAIRYRRVPVVRLWGRG